MLIAATDEVLRDLPVTWMQFSSSSEAAALLMGICSFECVFMFFLSEELLCPGPHTLASRYCSRSTCGSVPPRPTPRPPPSAGWCHAVSHLLRVARGEQPRSPCSSPRAGPRSRRPRLGQRLRAPGAPQPWQ